MVSVVDVLCAVARRLIVCLCGVWGVCDCVCAESVFLVESGCIQCVRHESVQEFSVAEGGHWCGMACREELQVRQGHRQGYQGEREECRQVHQG